SEREGADGRRGSVARTRLRAGSSNARHRPKEGTVAMIEIPTALAIAQWVLLLGLAVLLVVAYRQLAYLMEVGQAASAHGGLAAGAEAPPFYYERIAFGSDGGRASFDPRGAPSLLMFTDPACGSCEKAL